MLGLFFGSQGECTIFGQTVLKSFSNIGHLQDGRFFSGFVSPAVSAPSPIHPRQAGKFTLDAGDLLRLELTGYTGQVALLAFGDDGTRLEQQCGWGKLVPLDMASFDSAYLTDWIISQGGKPSEHSTAIMLTGCDEAVILRPAQAATIWVANLAHGYELVAGEVAGPISVLHQPASDKPILPEPLGHIRDEFTVKRGTAIAYELSKGEYVQIIDIEGQQCSDFQAMRQSSLEAKLSAGLECLIDNTATRSMVGRSYPAPGLFDKFYDADMRPLLRVVQDTCGRHDTFGLACTARGYEERGFPGHLNCSDNISNALSPYGVAPRSAWPAINFFWNTWVDNTHQIRTEEAHSRPGDYVVMEALDDVLCVSTACPDDIDPINGWNPTDIHVRIYSPKVHIKPAIAYRMKEDAPMQTSRPSAFHERLEPLTNHFAPARDLWAAVSFPGTGSVGEYWACREGATLQDMSSLRKIDIIGPDAERLLQLAMSRNISKLAVWRGLYSLMCDERGEIIDDGTLFRLAPHLFRWCCGSEESGRWLSQLAEENGWQVRIHDLGGALPNLALQGPKSRDILRKIIFTQPHVPDLDQLNWFGVTIARLNDREGAPFMLARTGYTGELGYELFCAERDALDLWDALMTAGADEGLVPMGSAALETIRIEAGLAGAQEFSAGSDALEAGLGFAVDMRKTDFIGKAALERNMSAQRRKLVGLKFACDDVPLHGAAIYQGERQVGVITSATYSPMFEHTIAMARVSVEVADQGRELEVGQLDGRMKRLSAQVTELPFYDPKRERARA